MESNDDSFTGFWSSLKKMECGSLFLNPSLSDDIFFNKLTSVTCLSEKMIDESLVKFQQNHSKPYIYSLCFPEFEDLLKRKGFVYFDTLQVLKKRSSPTKIPDVIQISPEQIPLWTRIFCEAYDCLEWTEPVTSILKNSIGQVRYYVDESKSSCMALYEKNSILGLYCLGTISDRRKQGNAESLVDFALHEVNLRHLELLMLETYESDNLVDFYSKLGFEKVYHKTIFTI
jgi:hypothetical protein